MTDFSTLAGQCGGVEVNRFSQSDYLQSYQVKAAEDFADKKFGDDAIKKFYMPRNEVGGGATGGACRALSVAYILSHRLKKRPNPKFGQKTYFQAFTNNAGQHPDDASLKSFLMICRSQLKFLAGNGKADENTGKDSAIKNVNAVCPGELKYAYDRWVMFGEHNGAGTNPFVTPGYWLISAGAHMTAMVVADDGCTHYFDSNEGDAKFPAGAAQFVKSWFTEKKWDQTRFIQFVDV